MIRPDPVTVEDLQRAIDLLDTHADASAPGEKSESYMAVADWLRREGDRRVAKKRARVEYLVPRCRSTWAGDYACMLPEGHPGLHQSKTREWR